MNKLIIALTLLLTACGSSDSKPVEPPVVVVPPVVIDTLIIHRNTDYTSLSGVSIDNEAIITSVVFSQSVRDRVVDCPACFVLDEAVILGDDKDCLDCYDLSKFLNFYERDHGVKVFIVIEDGLTFSFVEALVSSNGYSNIVLVSSSEQLLSNAEYNYESALIGESDDNNIDWHITSNSDCSAMCINPDGDGVGVFDGVIL